MKRSRRRTGHAEPLEPRRLFAGTLTALKNAAPGPVDTMLLLTNGTVLAQLNDGTGYAVLTPSATGSYVNGTWSRVSSSHDTRLYYSSQVMQNGSVFVAGGEYGTGGNNAEVYNPTTNTWTVAPGGVGNYVDADSELLDSGQVLETPVGPASAGYSYLYNPSSNTWTKGAKLYRGNDADEQNWVKLADGSILAPDGNYTSERYIPATNTWVNDATSTIPFRDSLGEYGTGALLPNGNAFYVGTGSTTSIYTPSGTTAPGAWAAGPTLPAGIGQDDAPMAVLPDGDVLFCVGPIDSYNGPTTFDLYDYRTNTITAATPVPTVNGPPFINRFLDLPDGSVLISSSKAAVYAYTDGGTPLTAPTPTISSIAHNADGSYLLTGTQLTGNSEGAYYGDDAQMNSNYPIVRLTSATGATVAFATTYNWSTTNVDTGTTPETTAFRLPAGLAAGTYTVNVMVNGFVSAPATITTPARAADAAPTVAAAAAAAPSPVAGTTTALSALGADDAGEANLTYAWATTAAPSGVGTPAFSDNGTNAAKSVTATFEHAGSYTFKVTITDADGLSVSSSVSVVVNQTLTSVAVTPVGANLTAGQTQQLTATQYDQFGNTMTARAAVTWSLASGGGTVGSAGLYTAPSTGTLAVVRATAGTVSGTTNVYVVSAPWTSADVGAPTTPGTAYDTAGTFTVAAVGAGVASTADEAHLVYQSLTGDGTIVARVATQQSANSSAQAGLTIRNTLDAGSAEATVAVKNNAAVVFLDRTTAGGTTATLATATAAGTPRYLKLVRAGSTFTAYRSPDGVTWNLVGSDTIAMNATVYVGLVADSGNSTAVSTDTFDHVALSPTVATAAAATPNPVTGTTTALSALGADANGEPTLTYTWAATTVPSGAAAPTFSANGTNAAKATTATFHAVGSYVFTVTITDGAGLTTTSSVAVAVNATFTAVAVSPAAPTVAYGSTTQFTAVAQDQFGAALATQPAVTWSVDAGAVGTISSTGVYTAPTSGGGTDTVRATVGTTAGTAAVSVPLSLILGTAGNDTIRLVRSGATLDAYVNNAAAPRYAVPFASVNALTVNTGDGTDTVIVDLSGGATPIPAGDLAVTGTGAADALQIVGTPAGADTVSAGASAVTVNGGTVSFANVAALSFTPGSGTDALTVTAGTLAVAPAAAVARFSTIAISADAKATVQPPSAGTGQPVVVVASLSGLAGTLDLGRSDLIDTGDAVADVSALAAAAFAAGTWAGPGLTSATAIADPIHIRAVGVVPAGTTTTFDTVPVAPDDALVRPTLYGDADLSTVVNAADYVRIDNGFLNHLTGWQNGDLNYDGTVDGSDYTLADSAFNLQGTAPAAAVVAAPVARPAVAVAAGPAPAARASTPPPVAYSPPADDRHHKRAGGGWVDQPR